MSDEAKGKAAAEGTVDLEKADREELANALRLEQAKSQVLLDEVMALEDELVNRSLEEYEGILSDATREFWREQLLTNRAGAVAALNELAEAKEASGKRGAGSGGAAGSTHAGGAGQAGAASTRRPLHNRSTLRPGVGAGRDYAGQPSGGSSSTGAGPADGRAVKIRNRAHEIAKAERIPFSSAFRRAERELGGE